MEVDKGKGKRSKRSPTSSEEGKLAQRLKREGVEVEMQEQRPRRKATEGVSYVQQKPVTTSRRMVTARRAPKLKAFQDVALAQQPLPQLERVQLPAKYYRPRSEKSSSSTLSKKSSPRSKSSNGSYERAYISPGIEKRLVEKLEEIELGDYEFKDLPKLKRNEKFTERYKQLLDIFKENITIPIQKITSEEVLINQLYITISSDLKKWLENLKRNGITKSKISKLNALVEDVIGEGYTFSETYDFVKSEFEKLFKFEEKMIQDFEVKNTQKRVEHVAVIDEGAKHRYYADYYSKRLEDINEMKKLLMEHKEDVMGMLDDYSSSIYEAAELIEHANEFVEKYKDAVEEYEASKKQKKGDLDDLIAMFGTL